MFLACVVSASREIGELLACNSIDIVAVQESWEKGDSRIAVDGYNMVWEASY